MSYAELDAGMVAGACRDFLRAREQRIAQEREETIACHVGYKKWFWSRPMTREQAEDFVEEELYLIEITGGAWARDIRDLQALAEMAEKNNSLVTVNANVARMLAPHFG